MTLPDGSTPATALLRPPASVAETESSFATGGTSTMTLMSKVCWLWSVPSLESTVIVNFGSAGLRMILLGSATVTTPVAELMVKPPPEVSPTRL
jgi:hypothetical protein